MTPMVTTAKNAIGSGPMPGMITVTSAGSVMRAAITAVAMTA